MHKIIILLLGAALGYVLDQKIGFKSPAFFFTIGVIIGILTEAV